MKKTHSLRKYFIDLLRPHKWWVFAVLVTGVYWGINNTLSPYVLKLIIDKIVAFQGNKLAIFQAVLPLLIVYIGLWVLIAIDMRYLDYIRLKLFPQIRHDIVQTMYSYLLKHSHAYFQNNFTGSLANKISDMVSGFTAIFSIIEEVFVQCVGLLIAMVMLFVVSPVFAYILLGWAAAFIVITMFFLNPVQHLSCVFAVTKTTLVGKMVDGLSNVSNIRLFSGGPCETAVISQATDETVDTDRAMQWYILKMRVLWDVSVIVLIALDLYALVSMYSKNLVTIGDFTFIISLSIAMFSNLWYLASQFVHFAEEVGKCTQALSILSDAHGIPDSPDAAVLHVTDGRIAFDKVTFHYDAGKHIFKNKSIIVEPGQKVGLVGSSGSGKSTFVHLIMRLFDVESGIITIDGQDISQITQDSLRRNIAMIAQDISLFHRTLLDNIRYGRHDASDSDVMKASKQAHCHEFISQLPLGYQTLVGERGIKLSGGQRQRIAIARAILKNAPILILDEATSALDSVTEKYIQDSLHELMIGKTTIVIAHRLSTLSEMDRILLFDDGHIIEDGSHTELIQKGGRYARMWRLQAGGFLMDDETENA